MIYYVCHTASIKENNVDLKKITLKTYVARPYIILKCFMNVLKDDRATLDYRCAVVNHYVQDL